MIHEIRWKQEVDWPKGRELPEIGQEIDPKSLGMDTPASVFVDAIECEWTQSGPPTRRTVKLGFYLIMDDGK